MGVVIDTSAIVDWERRGSDWSQALSEFGFDREPLYLPSIVWAELLTGVHLADTVARALNRREKLDRLRCLLTILPFTADIAEEWAKLFAELRAKGAPIRANDLCVIATAVFHGHRILVGSRDEAHFRRVSQAEILSL